MDHGSSCSRFHVAVPVADSISQAAPLRRNASPRPLGRKRRSGKASARQGTRQQSRPTSPRTGLRDSVAIHIYGKRVSDYLFEVRRESPSATSTCPNSQARWVARSTSSTHRPLARRQPPRLFCSLLLTFAQSAALFYRQRRDATRDEREAFPAS